jgi:hypothetical protein
LGVPHFLAEYSKKVKLVNNILIWSHGKKIDK